MNRIRDDKVVVFQNVQSRPASNIQSTSDRTCGLDRASCTLTDPTTMPPVASPVVIMSDSTKPLFTASKQCRQALMTAAGDNEVAQPAVARACRMPRQRESVVPGKIAFVIPDYQQSSSTPEALQEPVSPGLPKLIYCKRRSLAAVKRVLSFNPLM